MAFRTVVIKSRCKLEYSLNYLVYRGEEDKKILLDEIEMIIVETPLCSITSALLIELDKKKIKVIFCDEKHRPAFELASYQSNALSYKKIKEQIDWDEKTKDVVWQIIVREKIRSEARLLEKAGHKDEADVLLDHANNVAVGDASSREGHSAKVYFYTLFGKDFRRSDDSNEINMFLNYGYSIIASFISREIKMAGYLTELGIHHIGESNPFNLTYDFIEPLRSLVDSYVVLGKVNSDNYKSELVNILSYKVTYKGNEMYLDNAIHLYVLSLLRALVDNKASEISFIEYDF